MQYSYLDTGPSRAGWHRLANVLRCPRYYAFNKERELPPTDALVRGTLMHVALAHHYANIQCAQQDEEPSYLTPENAVAHCVALANSPLYDKWHDRTIEVYHQYTAMYPLPSWHILSVEKEVGTRVLDPHMDNTERAYDYTARIDLIVEHHDKVYFVDHKTSFAILHRTHNKYALSGQFLGQQMIGREMYGDQFGGVILNLIGWNDKKPVSSFKRKVLPYAEKSVARFPETVRLAERMIGQFSGRSAFDWPGSHQEHSCQTTFGECRFFQTCKRGGHYE